MKGRNISHEGHETWEGEGHEHSGAGGHGNWSAEDVLGLRRDKGHP